ncbi:MAG: hypothetical protein AAGD22_06950 [Verrucomicrobiota bacterium]
MRWLINFISENARVAARNTKVINMQIRLQSRLQKLNRPSVVAMAFHNTVLLTAGASLLVFLGLAWYSLSSRKTVNHTAKATPEMTPNANSHDAEIVLQQSLARMIRSGAEEAPELNRLLARDPQDSLSQLESVPDYLRELATLVLSESDHIPTLERVTTARSSRDLRTSVQISLIEGKHESALRLLRTAIAENSIDDRGRLLLAEILLDFGGQSEELQAECLNLLKSTGSLESPTGRDALWEIAKHFSENSLGIFVKDSRSGGIRWHALGSESLVDASSQLHAVSELLEDAPENQRLLARRIYLNLLLGRDIESSLLKIRECSREKTTRASLLLSISLAAYRLNDPKGSKYFLSHVNREELDMVQRGVHAFLRRFVGHTASLPRHWNDGNVLRQERSLARLD